MKMIQITEEKAEKLSEGIGKMMRIGGKLMECLEDIGDEESGMGMRSGYRRGGMRHHDDDYDDEPTGMRRGGMRSGYRSRYDTEY